MKHITAIIGINLIVLLGAVLLLNSLTAIEQEIIYFLPVMMLIIFNAIKSMSCYYKGDQSKARSFILSCLVILIIGGSSCVTIKFKSKKTQKKPVVEKTITS